MSNKIKTIWHSNFFRFSVCFLLFPLIFSGICSCEWSLYLAHFLFLRIPSPCLSMHTNAPGVPSSHLLGAKQSSSFLHTVFSQAMPYSSEAECLAFVDPKFIMMMRTVRIAVRILILLFYLFSPRKGNFKFCRKKKRFTKNITNPIPYQPKKRLIKNKREIN